MFPGQKHNLALEFYPLATAQGIEFEQQARGATPRCDEHRPTPHLAQKLELVARKAATRAHEEEKKRKADEKHVAHVNRLKHSRGEAIG